MSARPEQAPLTRDNDRSRTDETRRVIGNMVDGLNDHRTGDMGEFFAPDFRWMGNAGCGFKEGFQEFQQGWQEPFLRCFSDKVCIDEARLFDGEWAAAFGRQEATLSDTFMGIEPAGQRVVIRYMDVWRVEDGLITENVVMVDFADVLRQLGRDPFEGEGWERFTANPKASLRPDQLPWNV